MTGDIVVHISEGVYPLDDTLVFNENDGASNGFGIRYVGDGKTVISGNYIHDIYLPEWADY